MNNKNFIFIICIGFVLSMNKVDINNASYNEILSLPLTKEKNQKIWEYVSLSGRINTIYDLVQVELLSIKDIHLLKKHIRITEKKYKSKSSNISYKTDQWLSQEGSSEGIAELWLDRFYNKQNVNQMNYDDLSSLPNFSPMDVVAVLKQKERGDINGTFQLKNSPGISYYGYKNLLDFVAFESKNKLNVRYTSLVRSIPSSSSLDEDEIPVSFNNQNNPETLLKLLVGYGDINVGFLRHNHIGEADNIYTSKAFFSYSKKINEQFRLDRLVLGNFTASYGQGIIFESTDFFQPRRTGHKFSKRQTGINTDFTRSSQYVLNGIAAQFSNNKFRASMFVSNNSPRDGIINDDGSLCALITMNPRIGFGYLSNSSGKINENLIGSVNEWTMGLNLRFSPDVSSNIGFTIYESLYDRVLNPMVVETIIGGDGDTDGLGVDVSDYDDYSGDVYYLNYMSNSADPEINAMYSNAGTSNFWSSAKSFRRVAGFDFVKVVDNLSIQGEYGEIDTDGYFGDGEPSAFVINSYIQFNSFDLLILYRDYDLDFDNPYQRSFAEYRRYKSTIFEDPYWLEDPIYYNLYSSNPQPQAEKGYYVESRYQFHEDLVGGIQWDSWIRKADEAQYFRIVGKLEWRPVFNYRIYFRYKWQSRGSFDIAHPSPYFTKEARIRFKLRLSNYNNMEMLYSWNYTTFSPRPRLTGSPNLFDQDMNVGDVGSPDGAIGFSFEHNFDQNMKIKTGVVYADGFMWYIEDNDFRLFNTNNGLVHSWCSFNFKPNKLLSVKMKVSHTSDYFSTSVVTGLLDNGYSIDNPYMFDERFNYRIQIDYAL